MVAFPLIHGRLTTEDYADSAAADPRIDELRAKIYCVEEKQFSVDYHDPEKRSIGNALLVELNDGTVLDEVSVEYPIGHKRRVRFIGSISADAINSRFVVAPRRYPRTYGQIPAPYLPPLH